MQRARAPAAAVTAAARTALGRSESARVSLGGRACIKTSRVTSTGRFVVQNNRVLQPELLERPTRRPSVFAPSSVDEELTRMLQVERNEVNEVEMELRSHTREHRQ